MNSKIFFSWAFVITVLAACNNSKSDPEFNFEKIISNKPTDTAKSKLQITMPENNTQTTVVPTPAKQNTNAANNSLNPEHGQPGHRCDIAVGAPLTSKPTITNPTQQQQQVQTVNTKKTVTAPGMNPPHGEPGHRCDVAVGSPLNQPVKKDTAQNIKTVSPIINDSTKK